MRRILFLNLFVLACIDLFGQISYTTSFTGCSSTTCDNWNITGGSSPNITSTSATGYSPCNTASAKSNIYSSSTTTTLARTTSLGTSSGLPATIELSYKCINYSTGAATPAGACTFYLEWATSSGGTWTIITSFTNVSSTTCTMVSYPNSFTPTNAQPVFVRVRAVRSSGDFWAVIDDINISQPAPPCPNPSALVATSITESGANISWTQSGCTDPGEYWVQTSATPPTAGSGTTVACPPPFPINVSGLSGGTTYNVFVRQNCGGNGYSAISNVGTFTTLVAGDNCSNAIDLSGLTSPYSSTTANASHDFTNSCASGNTDKDLVFFIDVPSAYQLTIGQTVNGFDSENVISYGASCPSTTTSISSVQIACYDDPDDQSNVWINTTGSSQRVWFVEDGYSSGNSGTFTLAWSLLAPPSPPDCPNGDVIVCTTPQTNTLSGLGNWALTGCTGTTAGAEKVYKFTSTSAGTYSLVVTAVTGSTVHYFFKEASGSCDATGWTCIGKFSATGSQNITMAANTDYYILMDAEGTASRTQTFRIDCPASCPKPISLTNTNITANSADLSWTNGGSETMWKVSYGVAPLSDPATGTILDVSTKPFNLAMLTGQTTYDWYIRADCGGGDLSAWSNKSTFTTLIDCEAGTVLTCGGSQSATLAIGSGIWNPDVASPGACYATPGKEKVFKFTSTLAGTYTLNVTASSGSDYIDYFFKQVSSGCTESGWTCIKDFTSPGNATFTLAAGTDYYILLDNESSTLAMAQTFNITCPSNMIYTSSTTEQLSDGVVAPAGSSNNQIVKVLVNVTGTGNPLSLTKLGLNTNGSTAASSDISSAKVYYTGSTNTFSTTTQFGTTVSDPNGAFDVTGSQVLTGGTASTPNYFWVVYDLKCTATPSNLVDGECNLITLGGSDQTPTIQAPTGSRPISALYAPTYASVGTSSVTQGSTLQQIVRMNISGSSICPQNAESVVFNTSTSTAPATDIASAKCYYTTSTTFSSATQFGSAIANPPAGNMTFTGTQALASGSGNYFWLVYDVDCAASTSNVLNGTGVNIVVAGSTYTTTGTTPTTKTITAIASYDTKQDGPWNTGSTWACNSIPPSGTSSAINLNHNVTFDAADFTYNGNLVVAAGKNLTFTTNTLTVGPSGGGNKTVTVNGGLLMNGGVFNINGSLNFTASSSFSMTNGEINIDGNSGSSGTSISGAMLVFGAPMSFSMNGGTITIIDPNFTTSTNLISYSGTPVISATGGLLRFGDGNSSTGTTTGFYYSPGSGGKLQWYNVDINGGSGTRQVYCNWELIVKNKLDVKTGCVLELFDDLHILKDLNNDGIIRITSTSYYLCFGGYNVGSGTSITPTSSVQSITGNGNYYNLSTSPTANLPNLHVNNTSGTPIILPSNFFQGVGSGSVASNLYLTSGILDVGGGTFTLGLSGTSAGTLNGGSASSYIIGMMKRWISATTGARLFPIGNSSTYYGATINFTVAPSVGSLTAQYISGDAGSAGLPLTDAGGTKIYANTLCTTGYWQIDAADGLTGGTYTGNFTATGFSCIDDFANARLLKRPSGGGNWTLNGTYTAGTGSNSVPVVNRTGMSGFSQFAVSQGQLNPLPVELTTFKGEARQKVNMLTWETASEINSDEYIVERAPEAKDHLFNAIGTVDAKGNTTITSKYDFMDEKPLPVSYYRLKIMDTDGSYEYSKIIVLQNSNVGTGHVNVYPVPAHNAVTFAFTCAYNDDVVVSITDLSGRLVKQLTINVSKGQNQKEVNIEDLPMGMYHAQIVGADISSNVRIIRN